MAHNIGVAVIGCGTMGQLHAQEWKRTPGVRVLCVYDPDTERACQVAAATGAETADSWQRAVEREGVEVVSVCTPVCDHAPIACHALVCGRHVLVEKPIALTVPDAERMIETARRAGKLLGVSYQYRGLPKYRLYRSLIESGEFGGPFFVRFTDVREVRPKTAMHRVSMNGGPIIDMAGHYVDLMRHWTGCEPVSVCARGHVFGRGKKRLAGIEDLAVDAAEMLVTMTGGHILSIHVNWGMPEDFPAISSESLSGPMAVVWPENDAVVVQFTDRRVVYRVGGAPFGPGPRIADMVAAVRGERPLEVRGEDGLAALRVSLAAIESIRTGATVSLEE